MRTFLLVAGCIALASIPVSWLVRRYVGFNQGTVVSLVAETILYLAVAGVGFAEAAAAARHGGSWWAAAIVLGLLGLMSLLVAAMRVGILWMLATGRLPGDEAEVRR